MFGNILYFIIVLLIYATYQAPEAMEVSADQALLGLLALIAFFLIFTGWQFFRLERSMIAKGPQEMEPRLETLISRQSILAVMLFGVDIYGLGLPVFTGRLAFFKSVPTLEAALFLFLFCSHLVIIWFFAHRSYCLIHAEAVSRREYIRSNLALSIPILVPWFLLSAFTDILHLLPFQALQKFLATPLGDAIYFLVFLLIVAFFSPLLVQRFWGCRPLEPGPARERIEAFCRKAKVGYADILSWPIFGGRMLTAGVMGLIARFRYILVTPALLRFLTHEEIDAVMAHEIGHIKKKHLVFLLLFFISLMPTILFSYSLLLQMVSSLIIYFPPLYRLLGSAGLRWFMLNPSINALFLLMVFYLFFRYVFGYFIRNFERQADIHVFETAVGPWPLISSLEKIARISGQSPDKPNWHHFSIRERVDYVKNCTTEPDFIRRHHRKVQKSIGIYTCGFLLLMGAYQQLNYSSAGQKLISQLSKTLLTRQLEEEPHNPVLYRELGDYHYIFMKDYREAVRAYEKALALGPNDAETLNNLAWLFATCEESSLRNPEQALVLARKAAQLKASPHILDTLAESYYINGYYSQAVEAEQRAIQLIEKQERAHYEEQLAKFKAIRN